jgi:poly(hydroxyalkanoate) depolymerase family esterase
MKFKAASFTTVVATLLGLFLALPSKAASLQLVPNWGASGVPTNLSMYIYVPDNLAPNPPILVLLHYWGGGAAGVFAEAQAGGIVAAADQYGFIMVVPQNPDCWDVNSTATLTHDGGGHTQWIAQMVKYAINTYQANSNRVYVTGTSCGGMMTEALLAVYPDIFKAGAAFAGQVVGGAWTPITHTAQEWGNIARTCYPGYTGPRPRVQLWHGTADTIINYSNQVEAIMQWGNVLGLSTNPTTTTVIIPNITNQWTHQVWKDTNGATLLDAWTEINGPHGTDANLNARYVIPFLGLDKVGPVDLGAGGQRSRPKLNAARTTFVAENGQPLRGPYTSTEWTGATTYDQIAKMKTLGFNAVHLYGESFDPSYPADGSTAPGYATSRIDSIVQSTRDLGLYLVITIGNGAANGNFNRAYITNFWNLYSARYANETHVLFEIQNEPVAWGPPYSAANATPPGALDMEVAAYKTIRANAPDTPVLLFSYAVLGGTGGASAALTDIHAFNQTVFGSQNAVWTNTAVGFHGYAGAGDTAVAVSNILSAGYPCFMTEFGAGTWGGGPGGLDVEAVANLERLGVSWLAFQYIPPTGVSDDVTRPDAYSNRVVNAGLSWTPDYGSFPVARSVYGNGGYPWTAPDYNNNTLSGTLRIEAENFDIGGKGVAYYNTNTTNLGGKYRTNDTVSVETAADTGGGYDVNSTAAGDWLEYTMKISSAGTYNLRFRVAGTSAGNVQVLANGTNLTGQWTLPNTGGAQTWRTATNSVFLTPGRQKLRINVLAGGFNLNWIELSPAATGPIADGTYKILNAANALALDIDTNNTVVTATPSGSNYQQWNIRHIGGGQYQVNSVAKGNCWTAWTGLLHLQAWGWGASGDTCYIFLPTGGGYYRMFSAGGGSCFAPSAANPPALAQEIWAGAADQQWAILAPSAPAFPMGLSAVVVSPTQASLTWNAVIGATSYNVKRSTNSGGSYTTIATGVTTTNCADTGLSAGVKYYYVVSAVAGGVESLNSSEATLRFPKLTGTIIGTLGSWGNSGNTITNVFDNNLGTFFDAPTGNGCWAGLDFGVGASNVVTQINYCPRSGFESRMVGGIFQGANQANFSDAVALGTVGTQPTAGGFTSASITSPAAFRYVRYLSPNGGYGNVAELEFYGYPWSVSATVPSGLSALAVSSSQINLIWNTITNATSYNVERSLTDGGPYTPIASGVTETNYQDTGLDGGTMYYYVVSAVVSGSETSNSGQAMAATVSPTFGSLVHRYSFTETSGASIADSVGGPVWSGTLPNGGTFSGGQLTLASASQQHAQLPEGIVSTLSNFTIVAWVRLNSTTNWNRIFDFGSGTTVNMFLTPQNGGYGRVRFAITTNGGDSEQQINCNSTMSTGVWYQVAVTLNGNTGLLYLNGLPVGTNSSMTLRPSSLGSTGNNYLGRSQYPDPYLDGVIDEFRICNVGLSSSEIAATAALGPSQLLSTNSPPIGMALAGPNLTLSWPLASAGYTLQSRTNLVLGDWMNVTSLAPQIIGSQWQVTLPPPGDAVPAFYRLVK